MKELLIYMTTQTPNPPGDDDDDNSYESSHDSGSGPGEQEGT